MCQQVSRYFMTSMPGSFATPTGNGEVTIFKGTSEILDDSSSCPVITLLKNLYGLEGHFVDKVDCDAAELDYDTVIQCFLAAIFHHILLSEEWFAFSIDGQTKGVFAKSSTGSTSLVDVVAIQDCTMASQGTL